MVTTKTDIQDQHQRPNIKLKSTQNQLKIPLILPNLKH